MIYVYCLIHSMYGRPIGVKVFALKGIRGTTIRIQKKIYSNIVTIDGKLKKI